MMIAILIGSFCLLLVIGMPIAFAMALSGVLALALASDVSLVVLPQRFYASLDSFQLLAVPLFVLAGELMNIGGITARIVAFSKAAMGHIRGGLGQASVLSNMFMSAISGSAIADLVAIGSVMLPAMEKEGYKKEYSVAVLSAASLMGPIIPPSIIAVIYGSLTGTSIGALLIAGVIPGLIAGLGMMALTWFYAEAGGAKKLPRATWHEFGRAALLAAPAFTVPFIIIGGIISGAFTPTEAGALAATFALLFGVVNGKIRGGNLYRMLLSSGIVTASALITLAGAAVFTYVLVSGGFAEWALRALLSLTTDKYIAMAVILIGLFILGLAIEPVPALIMCIPVLIPTVRHFGFDEVQFGMVTMMMLILGSLTPPIGVLAMVACKLAGIDYGRSLPMLMPFILWWVFVTVLVAYVPALSVWLPNLLLK